MGFSGGRSSSVGQTGQSATQRHASNLLFEALLPGSSMTGGYVSDQSTPAQRLARTSSGAGAGAGGPSVSRQMGNFVPSARQQGFGALAGHGMTEAFRQQAGPYTDVQGQGRVASYTPLSQQDTDAVTKTLLPSLEDMRYRGMFERLQDGDLPEGAAGIISQGARMASDPGGEALAMGKQIEEAALKGQVLSLPELPEVTSFITDAYNKMPTPLKAVIDDLMTGGTEANLQASLDTNVQALTNQAQEALTGMLDDTYGRFAASGVSGGAMLAASGDVTTKVMADLAGQIANQYQQTAAQMNQQRQMALETVRTLINTGQQEQAIQNQNNIIELDTTMKLVAQKFQTYNALAAQFVQANVSYAQIIAQEVDRENTEQINSMRMFYEILVSLATGGPALSNQRSKSTTFKVDTGYGGNLPFLGGEDDPNK